jgi:hypothetical protein
MFGKFSSPTQLRRLQGLAVRNTAKWIHAFVSIYSSAAWPIYMNQYVAKRINCLWCSAWFLIRYCVGGHYVPDTEIGRCFVAPAATEIWRFYAVISRHWNTALLYGNSERLTMMLLCSASRHWNVTLSCSISPYWNMAFYVAPADTYMERFYVVPAATEIGRCYVALINTEMWICM